MQAVFSRLQLQRGKPIYVCSSLTIAQILLYVLIRLSLLCCKFGCAFLEGTHLFHLYTSRFTAFLSICSQFVLYSENW